MGKNMQNTQWVKFSWKSFWSMLMYRICKVLFSLSPATRQYESYLLPGFDLDPEDGVLQDILPGPSLCLAWHVVWCYWEHFQVFSEALGRLILLKCCHFNWGCHVSSVCIKSPFTPPPPPPVVWEFCWADCWKWQLLLGFLKSPARNKSWSFSSAGRWRCGHLGQGVEQMRWQGFPPWGAWSWSSGWMPALGDESRKLQDQGTG